MTNLHIGLARAFMIACGRRWGPALPGIVRRQLTPLEIAGRRLAVTEWHKAQKRAWYRAHRGTRAAYHREWRARERAERVAHGA